MAVAAAPTSASARILVVDDETSNRRFLAKLLARRLTGATVHEASDGDTAVAAVAAKGVRYYHIVCMDKEMGHGHIDGHAATGERRGERRRRRWLSCVCVCVGVPRSGRGYSVLRHSARHVWSMYAIGGTCGI